MRAVVRAAFIPFTAPLEGVVKWLYPDVKNLVSIGIGNLVDPVGLALGLPLKRPDGTPATIGEIFDEWQRVKSLPPDARGRTAAQLGYLYAKGFTTLRLTDEGVDQVVGRKLHEVDTYLENRFPDYPLWNADAQLGTLSMAWACGAAFKFPKLEAALRARDWAVAAVECFMPEEKTITGLRPRNAANRVLYRNACIIDATELDPDVLAWPRNLAGEPLRPSQPPRSQPIVHPAVPLEQLDEDLDEDDSGDGGGSLH